MLLYAVCGVRSMYVVCTSWAIRQLNSGHEATLIPIKKQNLTQGVRKKQLVLQTRNRKTILKSKQ